MDASPDHKYQTWRLIWPFHVNGKKTICKTYKCKICTVTDAIKMKKLASYYYRHLEETNPTKWWGLLSLAREGEEGRHVLCAAAARWHRPKIIGNGIIDVEQGPAVIQDRSRFILLN